MGGVLYDHHAVPVGEVDHPLVELAGGGLAGGAVGVAEDEHLRLGEHVGGDAVEVGKEVVLRDEWQPVNDAAIPTGGGAGDRIAGYRHQGDIARVDERRGEHRVGRLRPDAVVDLGDWVEGHAKLLLHEGSGGLLEGGDPIVGVAAVLGTVHLLLHHGPHVRGCHLVIFADAEVEHAPFGMVGDGLPLGPLDEFELVDLGALAKIRPADPLGESILEPGVCGIDGAGGSGHRG